MKIAKKVLAVVMAIAMIGCLTAMAFADPVGDFYITLAKDPDDETTVIATLYAKNATGFKAGKVLLNYDASVLEYGWAELGADAAEVNANCIANKNGYTGLDNGEAAGLVDYSFYFTETLGTLADFQNQAKKKTYAFQLDPNNFECAQFFFTVINEDAVEAKIELKGEGDVKNATGATLVLKEVKPEEKPTEKPTEKATEKPSEAPETTTAAGNPNTGDVKTGDTMALAAAAGVVALAGAAFIISKKRK